MPYVAHYRLEKLSRLMEKSHVVLTARVVGQLLIQLGAFTFSSLNRDTVVQMKNSFKSFINIYIGLSLVGR